MARKHPLAAARPPWQDQLDALAEARREQIARAKTERKARRLAKRRLTPKQARQREIEEVLERERKWDELRKADRPRLRYGLGEPSEEAIAVFRKLYAGTGRTGMSGLLNEWRNDTMRYGEGRRDGLDKGYVVPGKIS
jgi:hypothetical protein